MKESGEEERENLVGDACRAGGAISQLEVYLRLVRARKSVSAIISSRYYLPLLLVFHSMYIFHLHLLVVRFVLLLFSNVFCFLQRTAVLTH